MKEFVAKPTDLFNQILRSTYVPPIVYNPFNGEYSTCNGSDIEDAVILRLFNGYHLSSDYSLQEYLKVAVAVYKEEAFQDAWREFQELFETAYFNIIANSYKEGSETPLKTLLQQSRCVFTKDSLSVAIFSEDKASGVSRYRGTNLAKINSDIIKSVNANLKNGVAPIELDKEAGIARNLDLDLFYENIEQFEAKRKPFKRFWSLSHIPDGNDWVPMKPSVDAIM